MPEENNYVVILKKDVDKVEKNIKKLKQDREMYQDLIKHINKQLSSSEQEAMELKKKYETFSSESFISDHALLRYLERSGVINIKELKNALLTKDVMSAIYMGADKVHSNGYEFRIKNGKIVTIINENGIDE